MARTHKLKTWPSHYEHVRLLKKKAELRINDRDFEVGDVLILDEFNPISGYTGRMLRTEVTHMLSGGFGLKDGYVMLSLGAIREA